MPEQNPIVKHYLEQLSANLVRLSDRDRNEALLEIENHIAEATASGQSVAEVLEKLGPADRLARAYTDVAAAQQAAPQAPGARRSDSPAAVVALAFIPTLVIVPMLGGIGIGFTVGGAFAVLAGIAALFLPWLSNYADLPFYLPYGVPQAAVIIIGAVLFLLGLGAFMLLRWYLTWLMRALRGS